MGAEGEASANLVLLPSYCVPGTIAQQLVQGRREVVFNDGTRLAVGCKVPPASLSERHPRHSRVAARARGVALRWHARAVAPFGVVSPVLSAQVQPISFSAHADAQGLMWMVGAAAPKAVMLMHGEGCVAARAESRTRLQRSGPWSQAQHTTRPQAQHTESPGTR